MTMFRNDLEAAHARIEALERANRTLREAIETLRATRVPGAVRIAAPPPAIRGAAPPPLARSSPSPVRAGRKRTIEGPLYELGLAQKTFEPLAWLLRGFR